MVISKNLLDQLRAEQATPRYEHRLTPHGMVVTRVHSELEEQRQRFIAEGEYTLFRALQEFRVEQKRSMSQGLTRAQFNAKTHTQHQAPTPTDQNRKPSYEL